MRIELLTSPAFYFSSGLEYTGCPPVQTFNDGFRYGPCFGGVSYNESSKYWVATFDAELHCGENISVEYNGASMTLVVMDRCPGCSDGHIDMGLDALVELTGSKEIACAIGLPLVKVNWEYTGEFGLIVGKKIGEIPRKTLDCKIDTDCQNFECCSVYGYCGDSIEYCKQ
jgi:hypothetical protein